MGFLDVLRAIAALLVTLGLVGVAAVAFRRFGPQWLEKLRAGQGARRLTLVESLALDPTRRLVLVRLDGAEKLILLGEGRVLEGGS
ncbi:MAG: hypothetical protein JWM33_963 [Caulobacteraceae bacterium]|nr:hypothetical protein [Caulobacteraceae bacterium]